MDKNFPVVGIGASAGGLQAFKTFFDAMPALVDQSIAFVLVQHLSPNHDSMLAALLQDHTALTVNNMTDGTKIAPGYVYVAPPQKDVALINGVLQLLEPAVAQRPHLPIDFFFRSLAQDWGELSVGIVLSGNGSDGTLGIRDIKGQGGLVIAQTPESAQYDSMPRNVIATGLADYVLSPAEMPSHLNNYAAHAFVDKAQLTMEPSAKDMLPKIAMLVRTQTGHDFSQYKETTFLRRVQRRMALHQIQRMDDYLRYLRESQTETVALFRDFLIGVTSFFRNPEAFAVIETEVLPRLLADKSLNTPVRIWVCGCSTGEEAYSLAILVQEYMEAHKKAFPVQIFATDIDAEAIEKARKGIFPASIAADIPPERMRFFTQETTDSPYHVQKVIRDLIIFSKQDVLQDPPFSKLDMISCRNLLIYMNKALQKKLIPLFHYALNPEGALFLGTSETIGEFTPLFTTLNRKWKLYRHQSGVVSDKLRFPRTVMPPFGPASPPSPTAAKARPFNYQAIVEEVLLDRYAQIAILVDSQGNIFHIYGRTGDYLEVAPGDASLNILSMIRKDLRQQLTMSLHKAVTQGEPTHYTDLLIQTGNDAMLVDLTVQPISAVADEVHHPALFLVIIEERLLGAGQEQTDPRKENGLTADVEERLVAMEQDLRVKDEYLQTTLEEMRTGHEELKSTNEELQSVNEELQSTNEELETSKEELQSVNEELVTVNAELQANVAELTQSNNDMNNLLAGTGIATLFVDMELNIARFTPTITQVINLIETDIDRPVGHIVSNLVNYTTLVEDIQRVLDTLVPLKIEVQTKTAAWYLMNIQPYRTLRNVIEGVVITFVDITDMRQLEAKLRLKETRFQLILANSDIMMATTDRDLRYTWIHSLHPDFDPERLLGKRDEELVPNEGLAQLGQLKKQVLRTEQRTEVRITFPLSTGETTFDIVAKPIYDEIDQVIGVATLAINITAYL